MKWGKEKEDNQIKELNSKKKCCKTSFQEAKAKSECGELNVVPWRVSETWLIISITCVLPNLEILVNGSCMGSGKPCVFYKFPQVILRISQI